ncbi:MAG: TIR domain-containing protein, partial [Gammaproteobacteria bacterium]|nr:TIR domain-containing protein [Gammaproteobacteria bacterium]
MAIVPVPKVFISYYHNEDQEYKDRLIQALGSKAVDMSVSPGDIHDESLPLDEIRRRIRDNHIADATVTIVLIGSCTWQRKHVDWEISASLIHRRNNPRCGLLGLLLPTHLDFGKKPQNRNSRLIPQRLA